MASTSANDAHPLEALFHPRSVAVVGASPRGPQDGIGSYMPSLVAHGFHENHGLYPVNPAGEAVEGLPAFKSLLDCPDPVDHVISQIPARGVRELVEHCIAKRVRSIQFYTAGFGETGDEELAALQRQFVGRLREARIRVLGPNCMGLYAPDERLTFMRQFPRESGDVLLLSQSGSNAGGIIRALAPRGVRFSKVISFGNGADLNAHDFLDYAAVDPQTRVVAGYIEGVSDGRAFFEALRRCAAVKPTVLLKGGVNPDGARAANSHTGSLAGSIEVFDAACRQTGALRARSMDELHDLVVALGTELVHVGGPGVGLAGGPGGFAVLAADAIAEARLRVPALPPATLEALGEIVPRAGASFRNPIDAQLRDEAWFEVYRILAATEPIDVVFGTSLGIGRGPFSGDGAGDLEARAEAAALVLGDLQRDTGVPFVGIQRTPAPPAVLPPDGGFPEQARRQGVAVYPSVERAARTTAALLEWRQQREGLPPLV